MRQFRIVGADPMQRMPQAVPVIVNPTSLEPASSPLTKDAAQSFPSRIVAATVPESVGFCDLTVMPLPMKSTVSLYVPGATTITSPSTASAIAEGMSSYTVPRVVC